MLPSAGARLKKHLSRPRLVTWVQSSSETAKLHPCAAVSVTHQGPLLSPPQSVWSAELFPCEAGDCDRQATESSLGSHDNDKCELQSVTFCKDTRHLIPGVSHYM